MSDWRLNGQDRYLKGAELVWAHYKPIREGWDHDHCAFCSEKFSTRDGDLHEGYMTRTGYYWVCKGCFGDFKEELGLIEIPPT